MVPIAHNAACVAVLIDLQSNRGRSCRGVGYLLHDQRHLRGVADGVRAAAGSA